MAVTSQTKFSHKLFEPLTLTINEAKTHCVAIFDKLKFQREQGRFCDVILKVYDRDFPAHRCVLASCSPWFDTNFKVHKTLKEVIEIENCKNYEVFHLVLTYMYSGEVVINKDNVADILAISHMYCINKLKSYCAEFLEKNLKVSNCIKLIELAEKYHLVDFSKQTLAYFNKHLEAIVQHNEIEKKTVSEMQNFICKSYGVPNHLILKLVTRWMNQNSECEEHFPNLWNTISWTNIDPAFVESHLDNDKLYKNEDNLLTILSVMDRNNVDLSAKYRTILQEKYLYGAGLPQELADTSDFLLKFQDLENSEMYESISTLVQNMQNDSIGNDAAYGGPFRHPSGTDMEVFKTESYASGSTQESNGQQNTKKMIKRSISCSKDEDSGKLMASDHQDLRYAASKITSDQQDARSASKLHVDQSYSILQDQRLYVGGRDSISAPPPTPAHPDNQLDVQIPNLSHESDQLSSPTHTSITHSEVDMKSSEQQSSVTAYSGVQETSCTANVYKNFHSSGTLQMGGGGILQQPSSTDSCYRQNQYQGKSQPQFSNTDMRYNNTLVDHVDGELFKQHDLYRDDVQRGGPSYSQLGFLPPSATATEQLLFPEHQVFPRDSIPPNNSRDGCMPHSSFLENYKHLVTSEQQNIMLPRNDEFTVNYGKDGMDVLSRSTISAQDAQKSDLKDRNNAATKTNFDLLDYHHLLEFFPERNSGGVNIDQGINDQRLVDRSASTTKRYDPKFRVLAEASKQGEPDHSLFGYKGNENEVVPDSMINDYKGQQYIYKVSQSENGYRGHSVGFKQTDFMMDKNDLDCYRYTDIGRDCNNYRTNEQGNNYDKDVHNGTRYQGIAQDLPKESVEFNNVEQEPYHQHHHQHHQHNHNIKSDRPEHQISECIGSDVVEEQDAGDGIGGGSGGADDDVSSGVSPQQSQNSRSPIAEGDNTLSQGQGVNQSSGKRLCSGVKQGYAAGCKISHGMEVGEHNQLQQEFKNCRISERASVRDRDVGMSHDDTALPPPPPFSIAHQTKHSTSEERQWNDHDQQPRKGSWDLRSLSRHDHRNITKEYDDFLTNSTSQKLLDYPAVSGYSGTSRIAEDERLSQNRDQRILHQKKSRHITKDGQILDQMQIDCQFVENMQPISYDPIPISSTTPHYSRNSGSIIEPFRNSEILEPSLLELQDSFTSEMKKSILETPPRKDLESPSRRRQKTVPPPLILTPKEKYAKEINAERKVDCTAVKNVLSEDISDLHNQIEVGRKKANFVESNEDVEHAISESTTAQPLDVNQTNNDNHLETMESGVITNCNVSNVTDNISELGCGEVKSPTSVADASEADQDDGRSDTASIIAVQHIKIQNSIPQILKAKKKLATKKKMISGHSDVKLTHKQKVKLKQKKKKNVTIGKKTLISPTVTNIQNIEVRDENNKVDGDKMEGGANNRKIINLKDKLLAEHRSSQSISTAVTLFDIQQPQINQAKQTTSSYPLPELQSQIQIDTVDNQQQDSKLAQVKSKSVGQNIIIKRPPMPPCKNVGDLEVNTINLNDISNQIDSKCPFCEVAVEQRKDLFKHIKDKHYPVAPFKCMKCDMEYHKLSLLLKHYKTHTPRFVCSTCKSIFVTNTELRSHLKLHKPTPSFVCDICNKSFGLKNNLEQHKAIHSDERKYKCTQCGYSTKFSSHLAEHRRTHEGKVHRCTIEGCPYWTPKKTLLNAHMRMHNGDKKFICKVCTKGFVEAGQLRRHERIHTNEKQFVCDVQGCTYSSNRKDKLKEHKGRIHNREPTPPPEKKRPSKLSSLNKYYIPSVRSDLSEVIEDEDDPGGGDHPPQEHERKKGVNKYYSIEGGVQLSESQIPFVKEEYILGM